MFRDPNIVCSAHVVMVCSVACDSVVEAYKGNELLAQPADKPPPNGH